jgi:hypothetical protein
LNLEVDLLSSEIQSGALSVTSFIPVSKGNMTYFASLSYFVYTVLLSKLQKLVSVIAVKIRRQEEGGDIPWL